MLREARQHGDAALAAAFDPEVSSEMLVQARARMVDALIRRIWRLHFARARTVLALVAVGGYGRGELFPGSDIDFTVLINPDGRQTYRGRIETFITFLWDVGLQIGHSVRTLADCVSEARADITVATNLMESRLIEGSATLFTAMRQAVGPERVWPSQAFFEAKYAEQRARHEKYHNTAYTLEPNVKEGPSGLRDIQMIGWVTQRHFGSRTLHELVDLGFITEDEYTELAAGREFLGKVRFALHILAGRREDRLLFDMQIKLAETFGFEDRPHDLAVEQFMQRYYRTIMALSRLNEMLLQLFQEAIVHPMEQAFRPLTDRFKARNGYLEASDPDVFSRHPPALLEIFQVLEQHPELNGVNADTIRLIREHLDLIDDRFRANPENRALFMAILRAPQGVTHELRRMNRYGVLGRYLRAFGRIVGRMQYDLFHAYTVDEHILFVIGNLRRFTLPRCNREVPLASEIMQRLAKPELAYLAGLFHDIAKGRGGDHSNLGATEAKHFCLDHGLSRYEARFVAWLVRHHLDLSLTAQKKDISDPAVLHAFATLVGDQLHLDYLYVLTAADVRATNPTLWNTWKASLFSELYHNTSRAFRRGLENPIDKEELIAETQEAALQLLSSAGTQTDQARALWVGFSEAYFLHHTPDEIAWHTAALIACSPEDTPLVRVRRQPQRGGTALFIYSSHGDATFARATAALDQLGLTILDARIVPAGSGCNLDTYVVLEDTGEPIEDTDRLTEIQHMLAREIGRRDQAPMAVTRRASRQVRMFTTPTRITFTDDERGRRTVMEITAGDRPGLLSEIGQALEACRVRLQNARITTIGERAEDVFFITGADNRPFNDPAHRERLRQTILERLAHAA